MIGEMIARQLGREGNWPERERAAPRLPRIIRVPAVGDQPPPPRLLPAAGLARLPAPASPPPRRVKPPREVARELPTYRLPRGVRRIVALSNITADFSVEAIPLRAGDLVLHLNQSRHRAAAMKTPGTRHWLYVRHGRNYNTSGFHWHHDGTCDGFERVTYINDAVDMRPFRWFAEYKARGGTSPTTGFIVANNMHELYPHMPLLLAGFDPAHKHGTPRWNGHNWELEAAWYAERGFCLLPPGGFLCEKMSEN